MFEHIPDCLKVLDQWVCIHEDSKVPMRAYCHEPASSSDPTTWSSYEVAQDAISRGYYENIGFVFNNNGIVGIDIDEGYDEDGFITLLAADIIGKCQSYTERSRSGRGFHILVKGHIPFTGRNNLRGVEMYSASRYFIMTGDTFFDTIIENQEAIDYVLRTYFPETNRENSKPSQTIGRIYSPIWKKPSDGRIHLRPVYPKIPKGCRNICLTSLAGMLHNQGYSKLQIYDELIYCNDTACEPRLHPNELKSIVNSVTRYKR